MLSLLRRVGFQECRMAVNDPTRYVARSFAGRVLVIVGGGRVSLAWRVR